MIRRVNDPDVRFQTGHTKGNGSGVNMTGKAYTLESVSGGGMAVMDVGHGSTGS